MFECFRCLQRTVVWQCDYDTTDLGYEGEGVVSTLQCTNCKSLIEYVTYNEEK